MINLTRNEIPLRKQYSAQSLPPPPAAELKRRVQAPPPASSSKKRTFSIANPDAVSSMPVLHYGDVTPKDQIGSLNHRATKFFRLMNGHGGKSNKRRRGRKTQTRKYKKR